jgi:hypothetical protein
VRLSAGYRLVASAAGRLRGSPRKAPPRAHGAWPRLDPRRPARPRSCLPPHRPSASASWRRPRWSAPASTPSAPPPPVRHRHFAPTHQPRATPLRPPPGEGPCADPRASARIPPRPTRGARAPALRPRPPRLRSTDGPPAVASPPAHRSGSPRARARRIQRRAPRMPGRPTRGGDCTGCCGASVGPTPRLLRATEKPSNWPWTGVRAAVPGQDRAATRPAWAGSVQAPGRRHAARGSRWCRVLGCRSWRGQWQAHSDEKTGARRHEDTLNIPSRDSLNRPASLA